MLNKELAIFLLLVLVSTLNSDSLKVKKCKDDDLECHEKNKYTKEENQIVDTNDRWKIYLDKIDKAVEDYSKNADNDSVGCSIYQQ
jgi:hypothetical protein